ncbi:MAG TPA: hypothetical protein VGC99_04510, partial [Candidatus Tectomicrobia bacterium]
GPTALLDLHEAPPNDLCRHPFRVKAQPNLLPDDHDGRHPGTLGLLTYLVCPPVMGHGIDLSVIDPCFRKPRFRLLAEESPGAL